MRFCIRMVMQERSCRRFLSSRAHAWLSHLWDTPLRPGCTLFYTFTMKNSPSGWHGWASLARLNQTAACRPLAASAQPGLWSLWLLAAPQWPSGSPVWPSEPPAEPKGQAESRGMSHSSEMPRHIARLPHSHILTSLCQAEVGKPCCGDQPASSSHHTFLPTFLHLLLSCRTLPLQNMLFCYISTWCQHDKSERVKHY